METAPFPISRQAGNSRGLPHAWGRAHLWESCPGYLSGFGFLWCQQQFTKNHGIPSPHCTLGAKQTLDVRSLSLGGHSLPVPQGTTGTSGSSLAHVYEKGGRNTPSTSGSSTNSAKRVLWREQIYKMPLLNCLSFPTCLGPLVLGTSVTSLEMQEGHTGVT